MNWLANSKDAIQAVSYLIASLAAVLAWWNYSSNSKLERAKWLVRFYEKFYESKEPNYKAVREVLDSQASNEQIKKFTTTEPPEFTDYLNFFEVLAYLQDSKQLKKKDVIAIFEYYLMCLKQHKEIIDYVSKKQHGYEYLNKLLSDL